MITEYLDGVTLSILALRVIGTLGGTTRIEMILPLLHGQGGQGM
jgi:hypothetical protein